MSFKRTYVNSSSYKKCSTPDEIILELKNTAKGSSINKLPNKSS